MELGYKHSTTGSPHFLAAYNGSDERILDALIAPNADVEAAGSYNADHKVSKIDGGRNKFRGLGGRPLCHWEWLR